MHSVQMFHVFLAVPLVSISRQFESSLLSFHLVIQPVRGVGDPKARTCFTFSDMSAQNKQ
jgi:hypothetical protein